MVLKKENNRLIGYQRIAGYKSQPFKGWNEGSNPSYSPNYLKFNKIIMKKLLLILLLTLSSLVCFAETTVETTKISEEALTVLNGVCNKLQVPAEKVWTVLVSVQVSKGILDLIYCIAILTTFIICAKIASKEYNPDRDDSFKFYIFAVTALILGLISVINIYVSYTAIVQILYPEYGALREALSIIKTL